MSTAYSKRASGHTAQKGIPFSRKSVPNTPLPIRRQWQCGGRGTPLATSAFRQAGPSIPVPDYTTIDSDPLNKAVMALFRQKLVAAVGEDSKKPGYDGIIDLTRKLNAMYSDPRDTQEATRKILASLFPGWLPGSFAVMFSKPIPEFSCQLNAWATALTCQWLMGPSKVNDVEIDGGKIGVGYGVVVERCRYLEQSGCASVCLNSCKVPTQNFFIKNMGLPLTITPNYDDFSCQFAFGKTPLPQEADDAFKTPCFVQCPTKKAQRVTAAAAAALPENCPDAVPSS